MPRSSWRCESIQGFMWLHFRNREFMLHCWFCGDVRELSLQCLNSDLQLSIPRDWVCISYYWFPWQFGIYLPIHFLFKPHKKRCYQLLCIQWQIPSLITKGILTLAKKMMHLIAHRDLNPIHCQGYLCRLMHSSQQFLGLIARGWLKTRSSLPGFEQSNWNHSLNSSYDPVLI